MKATEIQLGNYLSYNGRIIKVSSITKKKVGYHIKENECRMHYARLCECNPISITTEILEKNGFECKHKGEAIKRLYWILYIEGGSIKVKINRGLFLFNILGVPFQHGFYVPSVNKHIQYFHELQQAMRIMGCYKEIEL